MNIKFQVNTEGNPTAKAQLAAQFRKYINANMHWPDFLSRLDGYHWIQIAIGENTDMTHNPTAYEVHEFQIVSLAFALGKMAEINILKVKEPVARTSVYAYQVKTESAGQLAALLRYYLALGWTDDTMVRIQKQENLTFDEYAQWYFDRYPYLIIYSPYSGKTIGGNDNWSNGSYVRTTFDKAFDLEFHPEVKPVQVPLNKEYTATVKSNGDVVVGCQLFHAEVIIKLATEVKTMLDLRK